MALRYCHSTEAARLGSGPHRAWDFDDKKQRLAEPLSTTVQVLRASMGLHVVAQGGVGKTLVWLLPGLSPKTTLTPSALCCSPKEPNMA